MTSRQKNQLVDAIPISEKHCENIVNRMRHRKKCGVVTGLAFWNISLLWLGFTRVSWSFTNGSTYKSKPLLPFLNIKKFSDQKNDLTKVFWLFMASFAALSAILFKWISIRVVLWSCASCKVISFKSLCSRTWAGIHLTVSGVSAKAWRNKIRFKSAFHHSERKILVKLDHFPK